MRRRLYAFRLKFNAGYAFWLAVLVPLGVLLFSGTLYETIELDLLSLVIAATAVAALVTYRGRRLAGWIGAAATWIVRHRRPSAAPSDSGVAFTVEPGDRVALRWEGDTLVAAVKLIPRPFSTTVIVDGRACTEDVLDTELLEHLLVVNCPDLEADVVSAGYRVGRTATRGAVCNYEQLIGRDPAPAHRRTWVVLRADPLRAQRSALRRDADVAGLARYLAASATRIADQLASHGVDAVCESGFDDYDEATEISFTSEHWSSVEGYGTYTAAYSSPGGPDAWWSVSAARTITRVRIVCGEAPRSTVILTTAKKPKRPRGFSPASGGQRDALSGRILLPDRHQVLPIGSAGVLVGQTQSDHHRVYLPFDDIDASVTVGDAQTFAQFAARAAAAGGIVTVGSGFQKFAILIGAETGSEPKVTWPAATTYLGEQQGMRSIVLQKDVISIPGNPLLRIEPFTTPDEIEYQKALPRANRGGLRLAANGVRPVQHGAGAEASGAGPASNGAGPGGNGAGPGANGAGPGVKLAMPIRAGAVPLGLKPIPGAVPESDDHDAPPADGKGTP